MWDVFCKVIDNYGDIGVSWRLARQLAGEHGIAARLWVDDLGALNKLCPPLDPDEPVQTHAGVEIRLWTENFPRDVEPGGVVIEAFGCQLPPSYIETMARRDPPPVWLNLEYLSAEDWVEGCHRLASPHPRLPLTKYFFFPGFTAATGGVLRERQLLAERDAFRRSGVEAFWRNLGLPAREKGETRISLFSYENAALPALLDMWRMGTSPTRLLVPEGRALPQLCAYFDLSQIAPGQSYTRDKLSLHVLPFSDQDTYDRLLWACDINFVRGEDSFVRAQWAGRSFVWHIYPQTERAHESKLAAFLSRYRARAGADQRIAALFNAWNGVADAPLIADAWRALDVEQWQSMAADWANLLAQGPELATELVKFSLTQVKSRPFD